MRHVVVAASALILAPLPALTSPAVAAVGPGGHQYEAVLVTQGLSWFDAEQAVEARGCGWYLATLTSKAEDQFVFGLIKKNPNFFLGGNGPWLGGHQNASIHENGAESALGTGEHFSGYPSGAKGEPSNRTAGHQDVEPGVPPGQHESF